MSAPVPPSDPLKGVIWADFQPSDGSRQSGYDLKAELFCEGWTGPFLLADPDAVDGLQIIIPKIQTAKAGHTGKAALPLYATELIVPGGSYYLVTQGDSDVSTPVELGAGDVVNLATVVNNDLPTGGTYAPPRLFFTTSLVRAATTANITIATALNVGDVLDGVTLAAGDRVLVKNQSAPAENGVYSTGASPARTTDFNAWDEFPGSIITVTEGTTNIGTMWRCTVATGGTLGTTAITYSSFTGAGGVWGAITGTLSAQTDLQAALDAKLVKASNLSDLTNAGTARTNLGGTTIGQAFFTKTNPGAIAFPRANADNTLDLLSASDFRTAIGAGTGSGTVTSVGWTGGIVTVGTGTTTPAFTIAGTSGGIPYFSSSSTWATSAALAANSLVKGGGAGVAPSTITTGTGVLTALGATTNATGGLVTFSGNIGAASATSVNGITLVSSNGVGSINLGDSATITISDVSNFSVGHSVVLDTDGTGTRTLNIGAGGTLGTAAFTAASTYSPLAGSSSLVTTGTVTSGTWSSAFAGSGSGLPAVIATASASNPDAVTSTELVAQTRLRLGASSEVNLYPGAANRMSMYSGTDSQHLRVYRTRTNDSNGRWIEIEGDAHTLKSNGSGGSTLFYFGNSTNDGIAFLTNDAESMRLHASGGLSLGNTTDPGDNNLSVTGTSTLTGGIVGCNSIAGGAGNMTITAGTGNSRTLILQTTTSGGVATTALTLNADQSAKLAGQTLQLGGSTDVYVGYAGGEVLLNNVTGSGGVSFYGEIIRFRTSGLDPAVTISNAGNVSCVGKLFVGTGNTNYNFVAHTGTNENFGIKSNSNLELSAFNDANNAYVPMKLEASSLLINGASAGTVTVGAGTAIKNIRHGVSGAMTAGAVTVTDTQATASTRYFFSIQTIGTITIPGGYFASSRSNGASFVITSSQITDTSTIAWCAIEP